MLLAKEYDSHIQLYDPCLDSIFLSKKSEIPKQKSIRTVSSNRRMSFVMLPVDKTGIVSRK